jgi:predicted SAM-dependent methyltransferase
VKLNLGCGDKILPARERRRGARARRPEADVICGLHRLAPFPDASADEVLAVHVVSISGAGKWWTCCASGRAFSSPAP